MQAETKYINRIVNQKNGGRLVVEVEVDTIFWLAEKKMKGMKLNGAFWRFLRLMVDDF